MKFSVTHARAFIGSTITVSVTADAKEGIRSVEVDLDGETLDSSQAASGTESYQQEFSEVGDAGAGAEHTLTVTATDDQGQAHGSTTRWVDTM